jgi:thiol-disulfide isomerase/thioredoxin
VKALRRAGWTLVVAVAAAYAGFWTWQQWPTSRAPVGALAPDFVLTDLDGKPQRLSDYRGKLVLVNFWATWCAPCIEELPLLVEAQKSYGPRGFQILGPAMDDAATAAPMAQRFGINYPVMADFVQVDAAMRALGNEIGALPYSVLVNGDGKVLRSFLGGLKARDFEEIATAHLTS